MANEKKKCSLLAREKPELKLLALVIPRSGDPKEGFSKVSATWSYLRFDSIN